VPTPTRTPPTPTEVVSFYAHWTGFVSVRSFAECDRYNPSDATDRRMRRAMEVVVASLFDDIVMILC
jgi:hypothetical protein